MNEVELERTIRGDLQEARRVVYLEGVTDVPIFFALLGVARPRDDRHEGVLVRGLKSRSGGTAVRQHVEFAAKRNFSGIYGIIDGDGRSHADLASTFDPPFVGPLFTWKAYCIENLLAKTGWPWGPGLDWVEALLPFAPYVALNRLHVRLRDALRTLRLAAFQHPNADGDLQSTESVAAALRKDKALIAQFDVEQEFLQEVSFYESTLHKSLDEAHALLNGKWLLDVLAARRSGHNNRDLRLQAWLTHAIAAGGLPEVRALWQRISCPT